MKLYLDASVIVALFTEDALSAQADALLRSATDVSFISDFAAAEFASAVARKVRMDVLTDFGAREAFSDFDIWRTRSVERAETLPVDVAVAESFLRRLDLSLRTADAINIAIAQRLGATLATLDKRMAADAGVLGVPGL